MPRALIAILVGFWLAWAGGGGAAAAEAPLAPGSVATPNVVGELVSASDALPAGGGRVTLALRQKINPGWHTYWRNPGDSGEPTRVFWRLPEGFSAGPLQWAPPSRLPFGPLVNFGFTGEVLLLAELDVPAGLSPSREVRIEARADWLVCEEICIPETVELALVLPISDTPGPHPRWAGPMERARAALPEPSPFPAGYAHTEEGLRIWVEAPALVPALEEGRLLSAAFFPYEDGFLVNAEPQVLSYGSAGFLFDLKPGYRLRGGKPGPEEIEGVLVLTERLEAGEGVRAIHLAAAKGPAPAGVADTRFAAAAQAPVLGIGLALLFAFLGGIILNLMPCVFPVLALKVLGVAKSGEDAPARRRHGLLYAAGVLLAFAGVGVALLALRSAGAEIGWGFQLQEPLVVTGLAFLLFAVGLSLAGLFELGSRLQNAGARLAAQPGDAGAFFTGVLAVVVAAPCTAPFMASALGFALTQSAGTGVLIFLALGLGLAAPYLLFAYLPGAAALLPKPGPWMERLKRVLAIPMFATAAWLLWVLARQVGPLGLAAAMAGIALIAVAGGLWRFAPARGLARGGAGAALALALVLPFLAPAPEAPVRLAGNAAGVALPDEGGIPYETYSEARLQDARKAGQPVFVNFTAAWCISCIVNEQVTLRSDAVLDAFAERGVLALKGDWTNRDAEITRALKRHGRSGVPLYVLYPGAGAENPVPQVLPPVLTPGLLLQALDQAGKGLTPVASMR